LSIAAKAAFASSSVLILVLVTWNFLATAHRSLADGLSYLLWVVPLFVIVALLNWVSIFSGRLISSAPAVMGVVAFVLLFGLALLFSEATRSMGGKMTPLQISVTAAFALFNAACLIFFSAPSRAGA
jgi:hypothetical protein